MFGSLLGDGCLQLRGKSAARFSETHSISQQAYLAWKAKELSRINAKTKTRIDLTSFSKKPRCVLWTSQLSSLRKLHSLFYRVRQKRVTQEILNELDPLALAIWYQDDGYREPRGYHSELLTCSFSVTENELIRNYFKERWDIKTKIIYKTTKKGKVPALYFYSLDSKRFLEIVKPHLHPSMLYKAKLPGVSRF